MPDEDLKDRWEVLSLDLSYSQVQTFPDEGMAGVIAVSELLDDEVKGPPGRRI